MVSQTYDSASAVQTGRNRLPHNHRPPTAEYTSEYAHSGVRKLPGARWSDPNLLFYELATPYGERARLPESPLAGAG